MCFAKHDVSLRCSCRRCLIGIYEHAQVVRRPVAAVGNSIGGYISASLAGDYPSLVQGLVLVNSAGRLDPGYAPAAPDADPRPPPGRRALWWTCSAARCFCTLSAGAPWAQQEALNPRHKASRP